MATAFDSRKRIYDLYSFDAPYDLEPRGFSESLEDYSKEAGGERHSALSTAEDDEDVLEGLDLTLEQREPGRRLAAFGPGQFSRQDRAVAEGRIPSPVLGTTLAQRKELLKEQIEELIADIRKRERLEEELLEKADVEAAGLGLLLGWVSNVSPGDYPSIDARRTNLEREILALKKAGWDERLRCWRDLVMLKKELREVLEEYHLIKAAEGSEEKGG